MHMHVLLDLTSVFRLHHESVNTGERRLLAGTLTLTGTIITEQIGGNPGITPHNLLEVMVGVLLLGPHPLPGPALLSHHLVQRRSIGYLRLALQYPRHCPPYPKDTMIEMTLADIETLAPVTIGTLVQHGPILTPPRMILEETHTFVGTKKIGIAPPLYESLTIILPYTLSYPHKNRCRLSLQTVLDPDQHHRDRSVLHLHLNYHRHRHLLRIPPPPYLRDIQLLEFLCRRDHQVLLRLRLRERLPNLIQM